MFKIHLIVDSDLYKTYESAIVPSVSDSIYIKENVVFVVENRIFPAIDANKIILFGKIRTDFFKIK